MGFFSGAAGGLISGIAGIFGGTRQNQNIDKQIAAQREENRLYGEGAGRYR